MIIDGTSDIKYSNSSYIQMLMEKVLCVSASEAVCERLFRHSSLFAKRQYVTKLKNDTVHDITFIKHYLIYACSGALTGHVPAQAPHSIHSSALIQYFVSSSCMHETGQAAAQAPHLMQASEILPYLEASLPVSWMLSENTIY